jgi:four helix bundle protein
VSDYKKLRVWRKAHSLAINANRVAGRIRGQQYAVFRNQIIRSAMSVPTNIVEGREHATEMGFMRFLRISLASVSELEYHLLAARDIGAISVSDHLALSSQVTEGRMMLHGLVRQLKSTGNPAGSDRGKVILS